MVIELEHPIFGFVSIFVAKILLKIANKHVIGKPLGSVIRCHVHSF